HYIFVIELSCLRQRRRIKVLLRTCCFETFCTDFQLRYRSKPMKLLVVEDEVKTGDYVRQGLAESGFVVDLARTGLDGHHLALTGAYDLIILDVMLPDVDGWRIVQALRDAKSSTPV